MSVPFTCTRRSRWLAVGIAVLALFHGTGHAAQSLESVVMPGALAKKHSKLQSDCNNCHVRFDRAAQPRVCLACHDHRDVAADVRNHTGYHGRIKERECRVCHTEHKGEGARLVVLDERKFDHRLTDFALRGKHTGAKCESCHRPNTKHRNAPQDCAGCHRKDDKHKGGLGPKCETCHNESTWKETRFDHDKTRFRLLQKHVTVKCVDCHREQHYKDTPRDCVSCHRKDDEHKGQLGARCEKCHDESKWKTARFDHERDTRFPLRFKHREAKCASCHKVAGFRDHLPLKCASCHARDDQQKGHKGRYGDKCQTCHNEKAWKPPLFDHGRDTRYSLRGKHVTTKCDSCHRAPLYQEKLDTRCHACHERDDKHKARLGNDCRSCHSERGWRETTFDHDRSRFQLLGRHVRVDCRKCHVTPEYKDTKSECVSCHVKDDAHKGRFAPKCEDCHDAQAWKGTRYDHDRHTHFKLEGAHIKAKCHACHKEPVKDKLVLASDCLSCHKDDDVHTNTLGPLCQRCHVADSWRKIVKPDGLEAQRRLSNSDRPQ